MLLPLRLCHFDEYRESRRQEHRELQVQALEEYICFLGVATSHVASAVATHNIRYINSRFQKNAFAGPLVFFR
jgi:hypothetical protein